MLAKTFLAVSSLCLAAHAHMYIASPVPVAGNQIKDPLDASGSNFPCHGVTLPTTGGTPMAAGSQQTLKFEDGEGANTATHGGGSCQISITYETDPVKLKDPTNWKVIYSIEGGCPSTTHGNLADNHATQCTGENQVDCLNQFQIPIPKGVLNGHAILAWTWFNTIGNREMYMDCVNVEFTGGDNSEMGLFPSMFVANLASLGTCATTENTYVGFPEPGKYVTTVLPPNAPASDVFPISTATAAACKRSAPPAGGSYGLPEASTTASPTPYAAMPSVVLSSATSAAAAASGSAPYTAVFQSSAAASATAGSTVAAGGPITQTTLVTVTASTPSPVAAPTTSVALSSSSPAAATTPTATGGGAYSQQPNKAGSSSSTGSCPGSAVSCSALGSVVCIGTTQFGLCDVNMCAVPQALAAGTMCSNGVITKRSISRVMRKRFVDAWTH